ncbi:unnamed protein product [Dicrocoelium dendriticum]|nr:unnamed protein product [Dicrocoelium dendriticum]
MWLPLGILLSLFYVNAYTNPYVCTFDQNACGWSNDPNNWKYSWTVEAWSSADPGTLRTTNRAMCLSASAFELNVWPKQASNFASSDRVSLIPAGRSTAKKKQSIQARLWSPYLTAEDGFRCLQLQYCIKSGNHFDPIGSEGGMSLALLFRREGSCVNQNVADGREAFVCANNKLWTSDQHPASEYSVLNSWQQVSVPLSHNGDFKLILEGTIPAGYPDARICVDNITSYTEPCSALQKSSVTTSSQWSWAQYFGITFVSALVLGLTIPILFLVILIWACRRRHHSLQSPYTDNKLFSTNLWYYIGGKDICDDPTGFRGSASLVRSNKHHGLPSSAGTSLNGTGQPGTDVMDLPDVVIPGGRVVSFSYSGNTLGPGTAVRHMSQINSSPVQTVNCFTTGLSNVGTASSLSSGTTAPTPVLLGNSVQPPAIMTQSAAPNFGADASTPRFPDPLNAPYNACVAPMVSAQQAQPLAPNAVAFQQSVVQAQQCSSALTPTAVQQHQQVQPSLLPPPPQQQMQSHPMQSQPLPVQQHQPQPQGMPNVVQLPLTQFSQPPVSQVSVPHPHSTPQLQQHQQQQQPRSIVQPVQLPPPQQQNLQPHSFSAYPLSSVQPVAQQHRLQIPVSTAPVTPQAHSLSNVPPQSTVQTTQQIVPGQLVAAVTPTTRTQPSPTTLPQNDQLTEANQHAAMAALFAATGQPESPQDTLIHGAVPDCRPEARDDSYMDLNQTVLREDHPPPGYDEAIGLVMARPIQNGYSVPVCNNGNLGNNLCHNTMAKPVLAFPTEVAAVPALPPRRIVNGMGVDDLEDAQLNTCLSLAERYGLPVAEI